jgi:hypothetical protein
MAEMVLDEPIRWVQRKEVGHLYNLLQRPTNALVLYECNFIIY